jgi:hypothetical protein
VRRREVVGDREEVGLVGTPAVEDDDERVVADSLGWRPIDVLEGEFDVERLS